MKLYVARHGQTLWNTQKRMQGWGNSDLTELGIKQAKMLGKELLPIDFSQVISSPLGRTVETTKLIMGEREYEIVLNEDFKEMGFGSWEGQCPDLLKTRYPDQYKNLWTDATQYMPIDGESFERVTKRVKRGMDKIIQDNPEGNVLLVTHGMIVQVLILHMKGLPLSQLWDRGVVPPTSLTVFDIRPDKVEVIKEADTSHLK